MKQMNLVGIVATLVLTAAAASAEVKVTMHDGRVSIVAKDATVRQILAEWARVGQTRIVNVERIPGAPMTLELADVPEQQALDLLLRTVSGYMAAPRPLNVTNLSRFDRIVVMPTSAAPRQAVATQPTQPTPMFQQPAQYIPPPQPTDDDVDDDRAAPAIPMPNGPMANPRGPVFNTFPQPQVVNPQMPQPIGGIPAGAQPPMLVPHQAPGAYPTAPFGGVAVPGMVVQPPQQPGQPGQIPGQPVQPGQPVRRPGR